MSTWYRQLEEVLQAFVRSPHSTLTYLLKEPGQQEYMESHCEPAYGSSVIGYVGLH